MRLHRLEITAFGPFADTVAIDFDALSEAGLFLLTGATGAGKTSVLDAVCFALYGDVPGDRSTAKRLRSDQATPDAAPRVTLETTLAGRRFRISRSPAWRRPKKRGTGTTPQQASVTLTERIDGTWQPLTSRLDEAGHLVAGLVGMTMTQFTQVAMLPQGRFQAFLRARSEERHQLLQQLFRTNRFERIERWLRDRRLTLTAQSHGHQRVVADIVSRLSEATGVSPPDSWDLHDLAPAAGSGEVSGWADDLVRRATSAAADSDTRLTAAETVAARATHELDVARELARLQAEHTRASAELAGLQCHTAEIEVLRRRLDASRRAAAVLPVAGLLVEAQGAVDDAVVEAAAAMTSLARGAPADPAELAAEQDRLTRRSAEISALRARADRLVTLAREQQRDEATIAQVDVSLAETGTELEALPTQLTHLRQRHAGAQQAAAAVGAARVGVEALTVRLEASRDVTRLQPLLVAAQDQHRQAIDLVHQCKETWLAIREQRLTGMAAELASALVIGADCPVCGSADHPHPAEVRHGAPDAEAEKSARTDVDDAEAALVARDAHVRDLTTMLSLAQDRAAGASVGELTLELTDRRESLARLEVEGALLPHLERAVADAESRLDELRARLGRLRSDRSAAEAARDARADELAAIEAELTAVLGDGCTDLDAALAEVVDEAERIARAVAAVTERDRTLTSLRSAKHSATAAAHAAGFADVEDALAHALQPDLADGLERDITVHDSGVARAQALVGDPELARAAALSAPDLDSLTYTARQAASGLSEASTAAEVAGRRAARVGDLTNDLADALTAWGPLRDELALATRMASFAEGKSPDNRLQMRLSAYVLAHRLSQVVAAANARLATMSDRRYTLEHTARRGAGETRGGLSLVVRDDWSGETRDPATLSGGETFVVSLALALGLADVITQEVGGADLDTLFVDEGFGSLDAETLDDVMDTLDSLRDGGRVVGVVSHVAEMRDRIPTRLAVIKRRRGSVVELERPSP